MNWVSKHFYGAASALFIVFFFVGIFFYYPILKIGWYWIPIAVAFYFFVYLLLPLLRKFKNINEKLEKPILERIAKIINDSLRTDKELQKYFPDFKFKSKNAYVRLISDYSFREFTSSPVFDRVKTSIADYYFYNFMSISFGLCVFIDVLAFTVYAILKFLRINTSLMFLGLQPERAILLGITSGILLYLVKRYFLNVANKHGKRTQNLRLLLIHQQEDKIKNMINYLKEDENLRSIAKEDLDIP